MKRMEIKTRFAIGIIVLWTVGCLAQSVYDQTGVPFTSPSDAAEQQTQAKDLAGKRGQQQVDLFTGSFGYSIPIACAPARNGSEPALALTYSSGGGNDWCGMGWKLDIGSIERNTKDGFPIKYSTGIPPTPQTSYDDSKGFLLNLFGKSAKLFAVATNGSTIEYRAETDTDFLRCFLDTSNNKWTVYDKSGTVYYFGQSSSSRVANPKWTGGYGVTFYWALDQVVTASGDLTTVTYTTYTSSNSGLPERTVYPTEIDYNGHTSFNGYSASYTAPDKIIFQTEVRTNDWNFSYRWGFRTEQSRRLTNILCQTDTKNVWSYRLRYGASKATLRSLLTNVTVYGFDAGGSPTALLTNTFTYQGNTGAVSFGSTIRWTNMVLTTPGTTSYEPEITQVNPAGSGFNYTVADLVDIDGDGLPDRVSYDASATPNQYQVQKNLGLQANGDGKFGTRYAFGPTSTGGGGTASDSNPLPDGTISGGGSGYAELNTPVGRIRDINGDGLPDRVMDYWKSIESVNGSTPYTPFTNYEVQINLGNGFSGVTAWPVSPGPLAENDYNASIYYCIESGGVNVGFFDINGDGRPDRVMSAWGGYNNSVMTNFMVQLNTGTNFTQQLVFGPYHSQNWNGSYSPQANPYLWAGIETPEAHILDINGDGLPDRVMYPMDPNHAGSEYPHPAPYFAVEYDNGYGFESTNNSTSVPGAFDKWPGVVAQANNGQVSYNGTVFYSDSIWDLPFAGMYDLNGDGLPDRVVLDQSSLGYSTTRWFVYLNNGHGFVTTPITLSNIENEGHYSLYNDVPWWSPQGSASSSSITTLMDINGDGLLDRVLAVYYNDSVYPYIPTAQYFLVQLNQGPYPDLLTNINNGMGGTLSISYKPSTTYDNRKDQNDAGSGSVCPYPMQTVASVTESDGINAARATSYGYAGGFYDGVRREFHGFAVVTVTNPPSPIAAPYNRRTVHYFDQGGGQSRTNLGEYLDDGNFAKSGMEYRAETYGNDNKLYNVAVKKVNQASLGNGRYFPYVQSEFDCEYPGDGTPRITATQFAYDTSTGNLTNEVDYGEVTNFNPTAVGDFSFTDVNSSDTQYHATHYATISGNSYILDDADDVSFTDGTGDVIREAKFTYNSQSGTLATKEVRISSGHYATNSYSSYNSYGLVGTTTDPVGVQTSITYDSTYNTFPVTTTTGSLTTSKIYDARSGLVTSATDYSGMTVTNTYDAFFRLTESARIPVSGGSSVWMKKLDYPAALQAISGGVAVNYVDVVDNDGVGGVTNRTYIDGFGRTIQSRAQGENGNYRVVSIAYDERGTPFLATWPRFESSIGYTKPNTSPNPQPASWIGFDAAGRVATNRAVNATFSSSGAFSSKTDLAGDSGSPLAAQTLSYVNGSDPWWIVATDADGKVHKYQLDAFGRTNQILEVDGTSTYTNTLEHDLAGDLTGMINSKGEHIYFAYNDAGDLVAMADPHLGQWIYQRDYAGRVRVQTDGRSNVVSNSYVNISTGQQDPLGRLQVQTVYSLDETNLTLTPAFTNTYIYDSGASGFTVYPGLLYETTDSEGWEKRGYDSQERLIKTVRHLNINNRDYTNTYTYNDGDYVTSTIYPNSGPTITNTYWHGGSINTVSRSSGGSAYYTASASAFDEFGRVTQFAYGNGLTTTRSYYTTSERLETISCGSSGSVFNRTFTYTAGADIASISGTGLTNTMSMTYDNLHRIKTYSALTGSYGYDSVGNITTNIESGVSLTYDYGVRRPQAVKTVDGKKYLYDLCGNMIVRNGGATNQQSLEYDAENRLVRVAEAGTNFMLVKFGYADDGTRLWKWNNQNPTNLQVWIGDTYEEKGGKTLFHVYAGGQQVCTFEAGSPMAGGGDTNKVGDYYHQDQLTSSSVLSDSSGGQTEVNAWYPFGRIQNDSKQASFQVSRRFTGQIFDKETGLYWYSSRPYDPELGRFIQADTIIPDLGNPQSWNRYSMVLNDPLRYTDPTGHDPAFSSIGMFQTLTVQQEVAASKAGAPVAVGVGVAMITGGAAAPVLVEAGASSVFAGIGSGMVAGATGDLAAQGTQMGLGTRDSISGQEVAANALIGGALGGGVSKLASLRGASAGVQANKAAGDAWESEVIDKQLPKTQADIQKQITIKSSGPSGLRARLDAVGTDKANGSVRLTDAKASATAPLTRNQKAVYPELETHGGVVVGAGKPPYTGGTVIPPTKVDVIRKP